MTVKTTTKIENLINRAQDIVDFLKEMSTSKGTVPFSFHQQQIDEITNRVTGFLKVKEFLTEPWNLYKAEVEYQEASQDFTTELLSEDKKAKLFEEVLLMVFNKGNPYIITESEE